MLTPSLVKRVTRKIGVVNNEYLQIKDSVETNSAASFQWRMVTPAAIEIIKKNQLNLQKTKKYCILLLIHRNIST